MSESGLLSFQHIGVAVKDIASAAEQFAAAFGAVPVSEIVHDEQQGVRLQFLDLGGLRIELLEPAADPSPLDSILKRGVAIYHTCHTVADLDAALAKMRTAGAIIISPPKPATAFDGRRVAFVSCQGFILELLEEAGARKDK
ncbi:MAG: VOC family protein [Planctomycetota bacterium]